jgi:hypothetical protein
MSELAILTATFLAVATPLFVAVGVIGADQVRAYRQETIKRRVMQGAARYTAA